MKRRNVNVLKTIRVVIAIIVIIPVLLFFIDIRAFLPDGFHALLHLQVVPAIFAGTLGVIFALLLLTFLFGRVYCSILCPAGVLQDIFNRLACLRKKKKNGLLRFGVRKPHNVLRYCILAATFVLALFCATELCLLLDPYSNFGRIATHVFRPVVVWVNNLLAEVLSSRGVYTFYNVSNDFSLAGVVAAFAALLVFAFMSLWRGRLFCNTVCPVGSLLSLVSRFALFRPVVDEAACNKCGVCASACKAEAIDPKKGVVDMSLCVGCFNCLSHCSRKALKLRQIVSLKERLSVTPLSVTPSASSRRSFVTTVATLAATVVAKAAVDTNNTARITQHSSLTDNNAGSNTIGQKPVTPPGSQSLKRFKDLCTGCHLCVARCPSKVLKPADLQFGFDYLLKPYMSYRNSFCNYSCTVCAKVCPTHAIKSITEEEKKVTQIGVAKFHKGRCVVYTDENDCGACSEHCPTQAVHMVPYKGTLFIPKVEPELCVGCGGCESICPVRPKRAIIIEANTIHNTIEKPKEEEVKKQEINDFGF
jgi:ferredoxin